MTLVRGIHRNAEGRKPLLRKLDGGHAQRYHSRKSGNPPDQRSTCRHR
ncbi:hypothetical protein ACW73L_20220 [Methylolobus aquaticus]